MDRTILQREFRLREAQALDALTDLRGHLEVRAYVYRYKDQHVRGQRETLRSRDVVNGIEAKIKLDTSRYRAAYTALNTLSGILNTHDWRASLRVLNDGDIRHVAAGDGSGSEGRRELSWIWKTSALGTDGNLSDAISGNLQEGESFLRYSTHSCSSYPFISLQDSVLNGARLALEPCGGQRRLSSLRRRCVTQGNF